MTEPKHLVDWLRMEPRECNSDGDHHVRQRLRTSLGSPLFTEHLLPISKDIMQSPALVAHYRTDYHDAEDRQYSISEPIIACPYL